MIVVAALTWLGCDEAPTQATPVMIDEPGLIADMGEPFMKVNGFQVGRNEVEQVFRNKGVPAPMVSEVVTSPGGYHVLEDYALATALYRRAIDEKLYEDPQIQLELAFAQRQALSRAMQRELAQRELTDERVETWVKENADKLSLPQKQAREIVVGSESYARDLMGRLDEGEDFGALARDHSIDPRTAPNGGYVGWFSMQDRPDLGEAIFAHMGSRVLGPMESQAGWHIVEVLDSRDATPPEEQRLIAKAALESQAAQRATKALREAMNVEMQFAGAGLPEGHPPSGGLPEGHPAPDAEASAEEAAPSDNDASGNEAGE